MKWDEVSEMTDSRQFKNSTFALNIIITVRTVFHIEARHYYKYHIKQNTDQNIHKSTWKCNKKSKKYSTPKESIFYRSLKLCIEALIN